MMQLETPNMLLSIMILTRNRKLELIKSLQSCLECSLPEETEFVIVDNASQDGTKDAVTQLLNDHHCDFHYFYLPENIGCAAGRNEGLRRARGRYIFFLDDDAYIQSPKDEFFQKMIDVLRRNEDTFAITTSIFDTKLNSLRPCIPTKRQYSSPYHRVLTFHGGSSLIDTQRLFDQTQLFHDYQFRGMAELYPSLKSFFSGQSILEMEDVLVIHEPSAIAFFSKKMQIIYHYIGSLHVKLTFYPFVTYPILYAMFCMRIIKHLGLPGLPEAFAKLAEINKNLVKETASINQFIALFKEFGFVGTF